jgi:hypothetical protein
MGWHGGVPNDADGDGSILSPGMDYKERELSPAGSMLQVRAETADAAKATVRVRYGTFDRPDPSIRPWPASPERLWQSPDIEVQNERNRNCPEWFNVPWAGHLNTVIARVKNAGLRDAPSVRVEFYALIERAHAWPACIARTRPHRDTLALATSPHADARPRRMRSWSAKRPRASRDSGSQPVRSSRMATPGNAVPSSRGSLGSPDSSVRHNLRMAIAGS